MKENCGKCQSDYQITTENARLHLFIEHYMANHVEARCTNCGNVEVIFVTPAGLAAVVQNIKLHLELHTSAPDDLQKRANVAWGRHQSEQGSDINVPTYELTERMEQDIAGFASSIEAIPVELFWTFIEDDTNHDRPERWT